MPSSFAGPVPGGTGSCLYGMSAVLAVRCPACSGNEGFVNGGFTFGGAFLVGSALAGARPSCWAEAGGCFICGGALSGPLLLPTALSVLGCAGDRPLGLAPPSAGGQVGGGPDGSCLYPLRGSGSAAAGPRTACDEEAAGGGLRKAGAVNSAVLRAAACSRCAAACAKAPSRGSRNFQAGMGREPAGSRLHSGIEASSGVQDSVLPLLSLAATDLPLLPPCDGGVCHGRW